MVRHQVGFFVSTLAAVLAVAVGCSSGSGRIAAEPRPSLSQRAATEPQGVALIPARVRALHHVGYRRLEFFARGTPRPLLVELWYPTGVSVAESPKQYILSRGQVASDAPVEVASGLKLPLVILSHGSGGGAADHTWLTETLAAHGFMVMGVHHYGESRAYGLGTVDPRAPMRFWLRPADLQLAYAKLSESPDYGPMIDERRVLGLGYSAGGHTVLAAAGIPFSVEGIAEYCRSAEAKVDKGCAYAARFAPEAPADVDTGHRSVPFTGMVLLDPALGPSFASDALATLRVPVLIVATRSGDFLPFAAHSARYARYLPLAQLKTLEAGEGHFVFIDECSLVIDVMGVQLCRDASNVSRARVHDRIAEWVLAFFGGLDHE